MSLEWALTQDDWCPYKKKRDTETSMNRGKTVKKDTHPCKKNAL